MLLPLVPLQLLDGSPGQQFHVGVAAGEIQVLAAVHDGRTGRAHVDLLSAGLVEEFHGLPELGAPDDGVVHKEQLLALNELGHGNLLHLGHLVAGLLAGGHEGAGAR